MQFYDEKEKKNTNEKCLFLGKIVVSWREEHRKGWYNYFELLKYNCTWYFVFYFMKMAGRSIGEPHPGGACNATASGPLVGASSWNTRLQKVNNFINTGKLIRNIESIATLATKKKISKDDVIYTKILN